MLSIRTDYKEKEWDDELGRRAEIAEWLENDQSREGFIQDLRERLARVDGWSFARELRWLARLEHDP